jgi:hypothetical protein
MVIRAAVIAVALAWLPCAALADTWVPGRQRSDGSYAPGHYRRERNAAPPTSTPASRPRRAPRDAGSIHHSRVDRFGMPRATNRTEAARERRSRREPTSMYGSPSDFHY